MNDDRAARTCPICNRPSRPETQPFCSVRCADVDLQSWLTGRYAVAVDPEEEGQDEGSAAEVAGQRGRDFL